MKSISGLAFFLLASFLSSGQCIEVAIEEPIVEIIEVYNPESGPKGEWIKIKVLGYADNPTKNVDLRGWILDDNNHSQQDVGNEPGHIKLGECFNNIPPHTIIIFYENNGGILVSGYNCNQILSCENIPNHLSSSYNCDDYASGGKWADLIPMRNLRDVVQLISPTGRIVDRVSWDGNLARGRVLYFRSKYPNWTKRSPIQYIPKEKICNNCNYIGNIVQGCNQNNIEEISWEPRSLVQQLKSEGKFIDTPSPDYPYASKMTPYVCLDNTETLKRIIYGKRSSPCQYSDSTFTVSAGIKVSIIADGYLCNDKGVKLTAVVSGGNAKSFLWSTGETTQSIVVDQPDVYFVKIEDAYDNKSAANISVSRLNISANKRSINNIYVDIQNGVAPYKLTLLDKDKRFIRTVRNRNIPNFIFPNLAFGTYFVEVEDKNGCKDVVRFTLEGNDDCKGIYTVKHTTEVNTYILTNANIQDLDLLDKMDIALGNEKFTEQITN